MQYPLHTDSVGDEAGSDFAERAKSGTPCAARDLQMELRAVADNRLCGHERLEAWSSSVFLACK